MYIASEGEMDDILIAGKDDGRMAAIKLALLQEFQGRITLVFRSKSGSRPRDWKYLDWTKVIYRKYLKKM